MQPVAAILGAVGRAVRRDLGTFASLKVNNFFLFVALLIYGSAVSGVAPVSAYPFLLLLGLLLLFPLSGDPLAKIPESRKAVWPLTRRDTSVLRIASLIFSPMLWLAGLVSLTAGKASALLIAPLALRTQTVRLPVPSFAFGPILIRNNLRQMFMVLDIYLALFISLSGCGYRLLAAHPDPAAFPVLAMLAALALSTYAQGLFSLDSESGTTRCRLLPLPGWRILLAKDAAWLAILLVCTLPLDVAAGLAFGLTSLAVGRYPTLTAGIAAGRWRFTGGRIFFSGLQIVLSAAAAFSVSRMWPAVAVAYLISLYWAGQRFGKI